MKRLVISIAALLLAFLALAVADGVPTPVDLLYIWAVPLVSGVLPFVLGVAVQAFWRRGAVPAWAPWLFGVAMAAVRLFAPQIGGIRVLDSETGAVALTLVISAGFAELGTALVRALRSRRTAPGDLAARREV